MDFASVLESCGDAAVLSSGGFLVGAPFGYFAQRSRFCLRAAVIEFWHRRFGRNLRSGSWRVDGPGSAAGRIHRRLRHAPVYRGRRADGFWFDARRWLRGRRRHDRRRGIRPDGLDHTGGHVDRRRSDRPPACWTARQPPARRCRTTAPRWLPEPAQRRAAPHLLPRYWATAATSNAVILLTIACITALSLLRSRVLNSLSWASV